MQCRHDFHRSYLVWRPFRPGFPRLCTFASCLSALLLFFSSSAFPSPVLLDIHSRSQIGRVLQYYLIWFFAVPIVCASLISFGAWFHSLLVSLTKLPPACLVFPPSIIVCLVVALTVLCCSSPVLEPFFFVILIGKFSSLSAFQAPCSLICAAVWLTGRRSNFLSIACTLLLSLTPLQ